MLLILLACMQELSGSCELNSHCTEDEICAKGACMGRSCDGDDACRPGWGCAEILGSNTCLIACEDDSGCIGQLSCQPAPLNSSPQSESADYCL